jgi:4-carboxymuconolactone decarboxylase
MLSRMDDATRALVRLSCALAAGGDGDMRAGLQAAAAITPPEWIEELILQTHLFAGFPRALNGMREWRRISGRSAPRDDGRVTPEIAVADGERTCRRVYGAMYDRLRANIRELHPALDNWMIIEGYGTVLSRPALDLGRRELCIVAACAATAQDRQLQSHLHGARNAGVPDDVITATLDAIRDIVPAESMSRATRLWERIQ